jgi:ABC-type sugar transport system substrate-binding protein
MVLGLCDALREHRDLKMHERPLIIGYDGTQAVRDLLGLGLINGIVLQDATVVAERAVALLEEMVEGSSRSPTEIHITPSTITTARPRSRSS